MKKNIVGLFLSLAVLFACISCASLPGAGKILTTKPYLLPAGTDGSAGPEGTYVLFGDWPQTIKDNDVDVDISKAVIVNGMTCYPGSDGSYYVKAVVSLFGDDEVYNNGEDFKFSNGEPVKEGDVHYFKIEPIKWRVVTEDYSGKKLLVAENTLFNVPFSNYSYDEVRTIKRKSVSSDDYKYSSIRAYLNGLDGTKYFVNNYEKMGFINQAFVPMAGMKIKKAPGVKDKVFLLDLNEVTNGEWGFAADGDDLSRTRAVTDYSKAVGVGAITENSYSWWLRDGAEGKQGFVNNVDYNGNTSSVLANNDFSGVVPAIVISCGYSFLEGYDYPELEEEEEPVAELPAEEGSIEKSSIADSPVDSSDSNLESSIDTASVSEDVTNNEIVGEEHSEEFSFEEKAFEDNQSSESEENKAAIESAETSESGVIEEQPKTEETPSEGVNTEITENL